MKRNQQTILMGIFMLIVAISSCVNKGSDVKDVIGEIQNDYRICDIRNGIITIMPHYAIHDEATGKNYAGTGAMNAEGDIILQPEYDSVHPENDDRNAIIVVVRGDKWGVCDYEGNMLIDCLYTKLFRAYSNFLIAKQGTRYGVIDLHGKVQIPFVYDYISAYYKESTITEQDREVYKHEAVFYVEKNGRSEVVNLTRRDGSNNVVSHIDVPDDYQPIKENGKYGFVNYLGEKISCQYENVRDTFSQGLAAVVKDKRIGFIDKTGAVKIPFEYPYSESFFNYFQYGYAKFSEGLCAMMKNSKFGYIDKNGSNVIPYEYDDAGFFRDGLAIVGKATEDNGKYGVIDKNNHVVIPFIYDSMLYQGKRKTLADPLFCVEKEKKWGVCTLFGECLAECKYDKIITFYKGYADICQNGRYGVLDSEGNIVIPLEYELIGLESREEGLFVAKKDGCWGIVNHNNEAVVPFKYDNLRMEKLKDTVLFIAITNGKQDILDAEGNSLLK